MRRRWARWVMIGVVMMGTGVWGEEAGTRPGDEHGRDAHATTLPFTVSKETTGIVKPLREDGMPDYVGAMNAKYGKGVTPENNAFVAWLKVVGTGEKVVSPKIKERMLKMCGAEESEGMRWELYATYLREQGENEAAVNQGIDDEIHARRQLWEAESFPNLAAYLVKEGEYLDAVKEAFGRKRYWMPYVSEDERSMRRVLLPSLSRMREAARGLATRATLRAKARDFAGFLSDAVAMKRMGRALGNAGLLSERDDGVAFDELADQAIGAAAGSGDLSGGQCAELWQELKKIPSLPTTAEAVDLAERWKMLDSVILAATGRTRALGDNTGEEERSIFEGLDGKSVDWDVVLKRVSAEMDERIALVKEPTVEKLVKGSRDFKLKAMPWIFETHGGMTPLADETREAYTQRVGNTIVGVCGSFFFSTLERSRRSALMQDEMVGALVAAAGYRADKGKWPGKLGELVPGYLKEVPKDIYSEGGKGEVGFSVTENGAEVTSVAGSQGVIEVGVK